MGFVKGKSGNPGGRKKKTPEVLEVEAMAREASPAAIERLKFWMKSDDSRASVPACNAILDRAFGKPKQQIDANITDERLVARMPAPEKSADEWAGKYGAH